MAARAPTDLNEGKALHLLFVQGHRFHRQARADGLMERQHDRQNAEDGDVEYIKV